MATRKDLLKAQSFISRRMVAAFVDRDPDDPTPPLRRIGTASFVSVLLGVILLAGTALIGMLRPGGGTAWQEEGVIISDTSAGMLFVYADDTLWPMANVSSARLQAAGDDASGPPRVVKVVTETLKGTPQAPMHGIAKAPRQLPAPEDMRGAPIRLCSSAPNEADDRFVSLEFGEEHGSDDESGAAPDSGVAEQMSFVAEASDGDQYLISNGKSHLLWSRQNQPSPLVEDLPVVVPGNLWLRALPEGDPIEPVEIPDLGATPTNTALDMRVGDLAEVAGAEGVPSRYYIHLAGGLTRLSYLNMSLIQAQGESQAPRRISETDLAENLNKDQDIFGNTDVILDKPQAPIGFPSLRTMSVCATYTGEDSGRVVLGVGEDTPAMDAGHVKPYDNSVDLIVMDSLSGALLQNAGSSDKGSATFLVLNRLRYPIPDAGSRRALGYGDVTPVRVPAQLIDLIPDGLEPGSNLSVGNVVVLE